MRGRKRPETRGLKTILAGISLRADSKNLSINNVAHDVGSLASPRGRALAPSLVPVRGRHDTRALCCGLTMRLQGLCIDGGLLPGYSCARMSERQL